MNFRKIFTFFFILSNIAGLIYLLALGYLNLPAQDDYAYMGNFDRYGINSSFLYWYNHWQGRFTAHYLMNAELFLWERHISMLSYYIFVLLIGIYGTYKFLKNLLSYFEISVVKNRLIFANTACFIVVLSVYCNFEFNTFFWLNASTMYIGGIVFFILGISEILSPSRSPLSFALVALSFLYVGGSSENFAFVSLVLLFLLFAMVVLRNGQLSIQSISRVTTVQKIIPAVLFNGIAFLIMVSAPGNKVRMHTINLLFNGYRTVPVPLNQVAATAFGQYKILLVFVLAKLPFIISALPVFAVSAAIAKPLPGKAYLSRSLAVALLFVIMLYVFILPTVYATSTLGPLRSLTFLIFLLALFICYIGFVIDNAFSSYRQYFTMLAVFSLLIWTGVFIHDTWRQVPEMEKYNASEKSRLSLIAQLKERGARGIVDLDSLHTPHFHSYSNTLRNIIANKLRAGLPSDYAYMPADFDPLFYNEISVDTSFYVNSDFRKTMGLPFYIRVRK